MMDMVNGLWNKQLSQARSRWTTPYPRFRARADAGLPDSASPIPYGYKPLFHKRDSRTPVPYHFENLDRISEKLHITKQDWTARTGECPNCHAMRFWVHPNYEKRVCDRCTAEFQ